MGACDGARRGLRQGGARIGRVMPLHGKVAGGVCVASVGDGATPLEWTED